MRSKLISRSNLFLFELIIMILFFTIAAGIALNVFLKADEIASETVDLNGAIMLLQSAVEEEKVTPFKQLDALPKISYFDTDWNETNEDNAIYTLKIDLQLDEKADGTLVNFTNTVTSDQKNIYTIKSTKYYRSMR